MNNKTKAPAKYQIGVDEAGRGCLFGSVDVCAVCILDATVDPHLFSNNILRDSKTMQKEEDRFLVGSALMVAAAATNASTDTDNAPALLWAHRSATSAQVDAEGNILHTVIRLWHAAISEIIERIDSQLHDPLAESEGRIHVVVDGTQFWPIPDHPLVSFECMPRADALVLEVSAASILAKCFHDADVAAILHDHPDRELNERYDVRRNKGYGTAKHIAGIRSHGYTEWHRRSFRIKSLQT